MLHTMMSRTAALGLAFALAASASAESFTTLFGVLPNPGLPTVLAGEGELSAGVGNFPEDVVLNGLEQFTSFNVQNLNDGTLLSGSANEGQVIFLQNANFYVGGGQIFAGVANGGVDPPGGPQDAPAGPIAQQAISAPGQENLADIGIVDTNAALEGLQTFNNRIFGVFGQGRSDITFDDEAAVTEITLQAGITAGRFDEEGEFSGFSVGGNPAFGQSLPEGSHLADGDGTILVYTDQGLQLAVNLADAVADGSADFDVINQDFTFSVNELEGDFITRIAIVNEATALNSAAFLSELTVVATGLAIPEPASLAMLGMAGLPLLRRRR